MEFKELFQRADWNKEKHIPVIEGKSKIKKDETANFEISVGKVISHPNKTEHHIRYIAVYFLPDNEKFPYEIIKADFAAHGESINGSDTSTVYTQPKLTVSFKTEKSGMVYAISYCNIHGLWENNLYLEVE